MKILQILMMIAGGVFTASTAAVLLDPRSRAQIVARLRAEGLIRQPGQQACPQAIKDLSDLGLDKDTVAKIVAVLLAMQAQQGTTQKGGE